MPSGIRRFKGLAIAAAQVPGVGNLVESAYRRYFNGAEGNSVRLFCGIYPDFEAARRDIPAGRPTGYDNDASAERVLDEWLGVYPNDYPVLFWLSELLPQSRGVFDWGGNVGLKYFAYRRYLTYADDLLWFVSDVPAVVRRGEQIARREEAPALRFTAGMAELAECDILLASGVVQFVEDPFGALRAAPELPSHLIFNKVPVYEKPDAATLHNMGTAFCPYHLFNRERFIGSIEALGFELRDEWSTPDVGCTIPFQPAHAVPAYSGFYFAKRGSAALPRHQRETRTAVGK